MHTGCFLIGLEISITLNMYVITERSVSLTGKPASIKALGIAPLPWVKNWGFHQTIFEMLVNAFQRTLKSACNDLFHCIPAVFTYKMALMALKICLLAFAPK